MTAWRTIFIAAGLFNLAVGLPMLATPDLMFAALGATGLSHPLYTPSLAWMIAVFGVGYLLVARDPLRNRDIALIGALGKLGFVAIAWTAAARGQAPLSIAALASGDLAWALLFLGFYRQTAKSPVAA